MKRDELNNGGLFAATGLVRSLSTYVPATIVYRAISFARGLVLAWLLARNAGQYALLMVAVQIVNMLAPVVSLGLNEAVTRYVPKYQTAGQLIAFLKYAVRLVLLLTVLVTGGMLLFSGPLANCVFPTRADSAPQWTASLAWATILTIGGIVFYFLVIGILKGLRMFPALAIMELVHGVIFLIFSLLAVVVLAPQADAVVWAYLIALLLPAAAWGLMLRRKVSGQSDQCTAVTEQSLARELIKFGCWGAVAGVIWQGWQVYSLWHLTKFDSASHGDSFAAARLIGQLILIVGASLAGVVMTQLYTSWEKGPRTRANFLLDLYSKLAIGGLLIVSLIVVLARGLIVRVFPGQFANAGAIMPSVVLFFLLSSALAFLAINFALIEKTRLMFWSWLTGMLANIILAVLWVTGDQALSGAAQAAAWACLPALVVTLALIRAEGQPVSWGLILILLACPLIVLPPLAALGLLAVLIAVTLTTNIIFENQQKAFVVQKIGSYWRRQRNPLR